MTAQDFPITLGYQAISMPEYGPGGTIGPYHRGEDRAMPIGTPVLVNGVKIGLSGNSGATTGPHLHIGRFINGADTPPGGGGFTVLGARVTQVSSDPVNGNFVRVQDADGSSWVYLHLSQQLVVVGQELKGDSMAAQDTPVDAQLLAKLYQFGLRRPVDPSADPTYDGKPIWEVIDEISGSQEYKNIGSGAQQKLDQIKAIVDG